MQSRILTRMLLISMVPLLLIGSLTLGSLWALSQSTGHAADAEDRQTARDAAGRAIRADATGVAREIEQLLAERVTDVDDWAAAPAVRAAARAGAAAGGGDALAATQTDEIESQFAEQRRPRPGSKVERYLRSAIERVPGFSQLILTERNGRVVSAADRPGSVVQRNRDAWRRAWEDGLHIGDVDRLRGRSAHGLVIAARVDNPRSGERLGVLLGTLDLTALQDETDGVAVDGDVAVSLLTTDGELLAETGSGHRGSRLMDPDVELVGDRAEVVDVALDADEPGFRRVGGTLAGFARLAAVDGGLGDVVSRHDDVEARGLDWTALVEQPVDAVAPPPTGPASPQGDLDQALRRFAIIVAVTLALALAAAAIVSNTLARGIVAPLRRLSTAARDVADARLPALVAQAQAGNPDAGSARLPSVDLQTDDEIADVADAFNSVGHTAADLATDQVRSRRNVARMFVSLGRRNQSLLSRQLEYIDRLEREESDADVLEHLFQLDHLATRMRRNAESLLVIAGEEPPRRWSAPVPLSDVVRGAVGEVEDYQRVNLEGLDDVKLVGRAVGDVSHLLAELIENATNFSPPDSTVSVAGRRIDEGYSLSVTDHGVGMTAEQFEDANRRIDTSPRVDRVPANYLGLFVVGRLAARHAIRVRLLESTADGGVTARVLLPTPLIEAEPTAEPQQTDEQAETATADQRAVAPTDEDVVVAHGGRNGAPGPEVPERVEGEDERRVAEPATAGAVARAGRGAGGSSTTDAAWPRLPDVRVRRQPPEPQRAVAGGGPPGDARRLMDVDDDVAEPLETTDELTPVPPDGHAAQLEPDPSALEQRPEDPAGADGLTGAGSATLQSPEKHSATTDADAPAADADAPAAGPEVPPDRGGQLQAPRRERTVPGGEPVPTLAVRRRVAKRGSGPSGDGMPNGEQRGDTGRVVLRQEEPDSTPVPAADAGPPAGATPDPGRSGPTPPATVDDDDGILTAAERRARKARQRLATFQRAVQHGRAQTAREHDTGARDE